VTIDHEDFCCRNKQVLYGGSLKANMVANKVKTPGHGKQVKDEDPRAINPSIWCVRDRHGLVSQALPLYPSCLPHEGRPWSCGKKGSELSSHMVGGRASFDHLARPSSL
jgi:hypothetical protein